MKKLVLLLGLAAAFVLIPARAAPADILDLTPGVFPDDELAALSSSGDPFAVGGGTADIAIHFAFSAHLGPNGPSGYAVISSDDPTVGSAQGEVVCYLPTAVPLAFFGIHVKKGSGALGSAGNLFFEVFDGPDNLTISQAGSSPCSEGSIINSGGVRKGNIVVRG